MLQVRGFKSMIKTEQEHSTTPIDSSLLYTFGVEWGGEGHAQKEPRQKDSVHFVA